MKEIKIIEGFGDKHWSIAVYIDDQLLGDKDYSSESFQDDSLTMQLIQKMAKEYNITITNMVTHPCFRLSFYYSDVPATFQEYEQTIFEFYDTHQSFQSVEEYTHMWTPRDEDDEKRMIYHVHELNGGINFDEFYKTYLEQLGSIFESEEWKNYSILTNHPSKRDSDETRNAYKNVQNSLENRLEWTWNAPKEVEPYKQAWLEQQPKI